MQTTYERALLVMVTNRLCEPDSKLGLWEPVVSYSLSAIILGLEAWAMYEAINSQSNRDELARALGKYLLATRMAPISEAKHGLLGKRGAYNAIRDNLHANEVVIGHGERRGRYIL